MKLTPSQCQAIAQFRNHLVRNCEQSDKYGAQITNWKVEHTGRNVWVSAQIEFLGLPPGNYLRAISHEWYYGSIGKRGAITLRGYPKSYEQFKGEKAFGFNIK